MMGKSTLVELSGSIKEGRTLPCIERPGQDPRSRILLDLPKAIFVPQGLHEEDAVATQQTHAAGNLYEFQAGLLEMLTA
eukprot:1469662-Pyramimonas_sp.AAC.1